MPKTKNKPTFLSKLVSVPAGLKITGVVVLVLTLASVLFFTSLGSGQNLKTAITNPGTPPPCFSLLGFSLGDCGEPLSDCFFTIPTTTATPALGSAPLIVSFNAEAVENSDTSGSCFGTPFYSWDFDNNGTIDANRKSPQFTYTVGGSYTPRLTVDWDGATEEKTLPAISVQGSSSSSSSGGGDDTCTNSECSVSARSMLSNSIEVEWNFANASQNITGYNVKWGKTQGPPWNNDSGDLPGNLRNFVIKSDKGQPLQPNTQYFVRVAARKADGTKLDSTIQNFTTTPYVNLRADPSLINSNSITFVWGGQGGVDPVHLPTTFNHYRLNYGPAAGSLTQSSGMLRDPVVTGYQISNLAPNQQICAQLLVIDNSGVAQPASILGQSNPSAPVCASTTSAVTPCDFDIQAFNFTPVAGDPKKIQFGLILNKNNVQSCNQNFNFVADFGDNNAQFVSAVPLPEIPNTCDHPFDKALGCYQFQHSYANSGTYTVKFQVKHGNDSTFKTTDPLAVNVSSGSSQTVIQVAAPNQESAPLVSRASYNVRVRKISSNVLTSPRLKYELLQNGELLGRIHQDDTIGVASNVSEWSVGWDTGAYYPSGTQSPLYKTGTGFKIRATLFDSATQVATDESDSVFEITNSSGGQPGITNVKILDNGVEAQNIQLNKSYKIRWDLSGVRNAAINVFAFKFPEDSANNPGEIIVPSSSEIQDGPHEVNWTPTGANGFPKVGESLKVRVLTIQCNQSGTNFCLPAAVSKAYMVMSGGAGQPSITEGRIAEPSNPAVLLPKQAIRVSWRQQNLPSGSKVQISIFKAGTIHKRLGEFITDASDAVNNLPRTLPDEAVEGTGYLIRIVKCDDNADPCSGAVRTDTATFTIQAGGGGSSPLTAADLPGLNVSCTAQVSGGPATTPCAVNLPAGKTFPSGANKLYLKIGSDGNFSECPKPGSGMTYNCPIPLPAATGEYSIVAQIAEAIPSQGIDTGKKVQRLPSSGGATPLTTNDVDQLAISCSTVTAGQNTQCTVNLPGNKTFPDGSNKLYLRIGDSGTFTECAKPGSGTTYTCAIPTPATAGEYSIWGLVSATNSGTGKNTGKKLAVTASQGGDCTLRGDVNCDGKADPSEFGSDLSIVRYYAVNNNQLPPELASVRTNIANGDVTACSAAQRSSNNIDGTDISFYRTFITDGTWPACQ